MSGLFANEWEGTSAKPLQLDNRTAERVRRSFGLDPEELQISESKEVHAMGARAVAKGNVIQFAPGQFSPETREGMATLGHELEHVRSQAAGEVPMTGGVLEEPGFEASAERAGEAFASGSLTAAGPVAAPAGAAGAPAQMAGHAGVMIFSTDSTSPKLIKRVERNEYDEFNRVREQQLLSFGDDDEFLPQSAKIARETFPLVYRTYTGAGGPPTQSQFEGTYNQEKFDEWIGQNDENDYYVEMQSMGGAGYSIKDFKTGTQTANASELLQHGHKPSAKSAKSKEQRMYEQDDFSSGSSKYGIRDSDAIQTKRGALSKFLGIYRNSLTGIAEMVRTEGGYTKDSPVVQDIDNILEYLKNSDTVYVGSSVIIKWSKDRSKRMEEDRARIIDLAHPVRKSEMPEDEFERIKTGMIFGIKNIRRLLLAKDMRKLYHGKRAPSPKAQEAGVLASGTGKKASKYLPKLKQRSLTKRMRSVFKVKSKGNQEEPETTEPTTETGPEPQPEQIPLVTGLETQTDTAPAPTQTAPAPVPDLLQEADPETASGEDMHATLQKQYVQALAGGDDVMAQYFGSMLRGSMHSRNSALADAKKKTNNPFKKLWNKIKGK